LAHYEKEMEKERLLGGGAGRLEYLRTRELVARHLPPADATILDVGGGAGAYALPLAEEGFPELPQNFSEHPLSASE
jgi:2-polyprenyl-3-methyl-5-hydroxy-6-metoxy-1,4-benzoquinol methylase